MGQTLTHGIYLPEEGERNCYDGLASNWSILDGAVGTIAEHTSALAGKAPAVHTHTKADITDFPAYGTTAGTICEGNDSRLSDARTPVAHTHTKSDVTDLFNSANTWTSWQTLENTNANSLLRLRRTDIKIGDAIPSAQKEVGSIAFAGSDNINLGLIACRDNTTGDTYLTLITRQRYDSNGRANNGTQYESRIDLGVDSSKNLYLRPNSNGNVELGTSTNKWKTLNGVNPGALSLPDTTREEPIDTTNWVYSYTAPNVYYPPKDGWLAVACSGSDYIQIDSSTGWGITLSKGYDGYCTGIIPVKKNARTQIRIKETSSGSVVVRKASFYPGTGDPSFTVTPLNNS